MVDGERTMRIYKRIDLDDLPIDLVRVVVNEKDQEDIKIVYTPKQTKLKVCSMCLKKKQILFVEGKFILGTRINHLNAKDEYLLLCEGCATAREI